jgi:hypothetical protein
MFILTLLSKFKLKKMIRREKNEFYQKHVSPTSPKYYEENKFSNQVLSFPYLKNHSMRHFIAGTKSSIVKNPR